MSDPRAKTGRDCLGTMPCRLSSWISSFAPASRSDGFGPLPWLCRIQRHHDAPGEPDSEHPRDGVPVAGTQEAHSRFRAPDSVSSQPQGDRACPFEKLGPAADRFVVLDGRVIGGALESPPQRTSGRVRGCHGPTVALVASMRSRSLSERRSRRRGVSGARSGQMNEPGEGGDESVDRGGVEEAGVVLHRAEELSVGLSHVQGEIERGRAGVDGEWFDLERSGRRGG